MRAAAVLALPAVVLRSVEGRWISSIVGAPFDPPGIRHMHESFLGGRVTGAFHSLVAPSSGTLVGDALAYRSASRVALRPVAGFEFARNERIRVEWPVLSTLDRREVRLLDRTGKPLPVDLPLAEDPATHAVIVEMSVSGLGRGDYLIELTAGAGAVKETRLVAVRIK